MLFPRTRYAAGRRAVFYCFLSKTDCLPTRQLSSNARNSASDFLANK